MKKRTALFIYCISLILVACGENKSKLTKDEFLGNVKTAIESSDVEKFKLLISPKCPGGDFFIKMYTDSGTNLESVKLLPKDADQLLLRYLPPHPVENIIELTLKKVTGGKSSTQQSFKIPLVKYDDSFYLVVPSCYTKKETKIESISGNKFFLKDGVHKQITVGEYSIILDRIDDKASFNGKQMTRIYLKSKPRNKNLIIEAYDKSGNKIANGSYGQNLSVSESSNHNYLFKEMPDYILLK